MKYIVKHPGHAPEVLEEEKITLKLLQEHVEGLITCPSFPGIDEEGMTIFANDEGLLLGMIPNIGAMVYGGPLVLVGPVVVAGIDEEGETVGLTDEQEKKALAVLEKATTELPLVLAALI